MTNLSKNGAYRSADVWLPGVEVPLRLVLTPENDYLIEQQQIAFVGGKKSEKSVRYLLKQSKPFNDRMKNAITSGQIQVGQGCDTSEVVKVDHNKGVSRLYTIQSAVLIWQHWAESGSARCKAIIGALTIEALERRADAVFKVGRSKAERDRRLAKNFSFIEGIDFAKFSDQEDATYYAWICRDFFELPPRKVKPLLLKSDDGYAALGAYLKKYYPHIDRQQKTHEQIEALASYFADELKQFCSYEP